MEIQPLSRKALESIRDSTARINIWYGAVRSGKTIASLIRWIEYSATAPAGPLLMAGKTERALYRNILDPLHELVGSKHFRLNRGDGVLDFLGRKVWLAGANDAASEGKIRGLTLAGAYGDEISLWPDTFFKMLMTRLSVPGSKFFGTSNPDVPRHWLKADYIDRANELDLRAFFFQLEDNLTLSEPYKAALESEYKGLWHKRFVEGLWVAGEGAVYDCFDASQMVTEDIPPITKYFVGIDYGTTNPTVFLLAGLGTDKRFYIIDEYRWDSSAKGHQKSDSEYAQDLGEFIGKHGVNPSFIIVDPSAASFIVQLHRSGFSGVTKAKNEVLSGIRSVSSLMAADRLRIAPQCTGLIDELEGYSWDDKALKRGQEAPAKQNDHGADSVRYIVFTTRQYWQNWLKPQTENSIGRPKKYLPDHFFR